jgi:hypothetical protein
MLEGLMPEATAALRQSADFVCDHLEPGTAGALPRRAANIHISETHAN